MRHRESRRTLLTESPWDGFRAVLRQCEDQRSRVHSVERHALRRRLDVSGAGDRADEKGLGQADQALRLAEEGRARHFTGAEAPITAHAPGYIDRDLEIIVGLQTEAPLKRAIMPNGGLRMVLSASRCTATRRTRTSWKLSPNTGRPTTKACSTRHLGHPEMPELAPADGPARCVWPRPHRSAITGAFPSTGLDRLIAHKQQEKLALDAEPSFFSDSSAIAKNSPSRHERSRQELKTMAASYGYDISRPATTAREAVQWLDFAYLAAVKEQNGAAMSLGRCSTFLDIYFERDLKAGRLTEEQAQEIVDDFVIKLRIVRFLRTPEYDELFAGYSTWVTESIGGMGDDGRSL